MTSLGTEAMSAREAEVLDALREHLTNAEIAQRLHISVRTVESHVSSLLRKLGATDRRELAALALADEVVPAPAIAHRDLRGLPSTWTTFVGRAELLDELSDALIDSRLVTLVGPGGIGKTRLAVVAAEQAAADFPAGGAFINLVPVGSGFVVEAAAAALGVVERAQESLEDIVHERLREGRVLLVLDNCEHVLAAAASFAQAVLAACPEAVILATSRERLGVTGERVVPVPPLSVGDEGEGSDAELLFVDRAASAAGSGEDPTLVAEVCRRLDGMPLAIELAAARSGSLGVDGLLAGLDDHLRLLSRSSAADDRHGSLRNVIDWSHQLLDDDERQFFRRLGVFAGAFDLVSAATVAADGDLVTASDMIGRLADKSLLVHGHGPDGSRWRMLETVHAYALEQLEASGEEDELRQRHLTWATAAAVDLERSLDADEDAWQDAFDAVADDLRAALAAAGGSRGPDGADFHLAFALAHLTYARRFLAEARDHYQDAVRRAPDEAAAVTALRASADEAFAEMRGETAYGLLIEASDRAAAAGDDRVAAIALADAASIAGRAPATFAEPLAHEQLVALADRARALAPADDLQVAAHIAVGSAWDGHRRPVVPEADKAEEALRLAREVGDPVLISNALDAVGAAATFDGQFKEAARLAVERLDLLDELARHDPRVGGEVSDIFHMANETAVAAGQLDAALAYAQQSRDDRIGQGLAHFAATHMILPLTLQGAFDEAIAHAAVMREGWERSGSPAAGWMSPAFFAIALVHGLRGEVEGYDHWRALAMEVCARSRHNGFAEFVQPRVAVHLGDLEQATASVMPDEVTDCDAYQLFGRALKVEVAVLSGAADAEQRLAASQPFGDENDYAAALLTRAGGILHEDEAQLDDAVAKWEVLGARFERACTLLHLPDRVDEGERELAAMRCPLPAR